MEYRALLETEPEWQEMVKEFPELLETPSTMITKSVDIRNLVHPARCLREGLEIDERMGQLALGLLYMSLYGLLHTMGRGLLKQGETTLNVQYSSQLKRLLSARETVRGYVSEDSTPEDNAKRILSSAEAT